MAHLAIVGAGGFGREIMPFIRQIVDPSWSLCFAEERPRITEVNGLPMLDVSDFLDLAGQKYFNVAIADSAVRRRIVATMSERASPLSLVANGAFVGDGTVMGDGAVICQFSSVGSNTRIGRHFHCNLYSYVAHDCVVGDYVTFAPRVQCNGNVHIGDDVYVGAGAVIRNGSAGSPLVIGAGAIIGMGAVVTRSVPANTTVVGNPARAMRS
jgi:sugar O-acyltransferase (sialic acid O-acetyltransferase NeuD family)